MDRDSIYLEVLKMARELVINEHTDRRAEMHNKWLVESEHLWKTQRLRLSYPTIPPYPTDRDIIQVAKKLLEFIPAEPETEIKPSELDDAIDKEIVSEDMPVKNALVILPKELPVEEVEEPKKVLPSVLARLEKMKNSLL